MSKDGRADGRRGDTAVIRALTDDPQSDEIRTRTATLLFSDIVGITPYFDRFGDRAGHARIRSHNELLFPVIQAHRGRVVKTIGDAIMAVFDAPGDGVAAAVKMQRTLAAHNRDQADPDAHIAIRIGLHSGPAIIDQADIFGDAVNVAARVSSEAEGDQILISAETLQGLPAVHSPTQLHTRTWLKGKDTITEIHRVDWQPVKNHTGQAGQVRSAASGPDQKREATPARSRSGWIAGLAIAGLTGLAIVIWSGMGQGDDPVPAPPAAPEPFRVPAAAPSPTPDADPTPRPAAPERPEPRVAPADPRPVAAPPAAPMAGPRKKSKPLTRQRADDQPGASQSPALALFRATRAVEAHMKRLELVPGDLPIVDFLRSQAEQLGRDGEHEEALRAAKRAARKLARFRFSKRFLIEKLDRMQSQLACRSEAGKLRCQGVVDQVNMLISRGSLRDANTLINEAAADMRTGTRPR